MSPVQNSQEQRSQKLAPPSELLASPEVMVTAKKSLFEAGEAGTQSPSRPSGCKARRTFRLPEALWRQITFVLCSFDLKLGYQLNFYQFE